MGETPADAVERFLRTWGPNCGAPRSVFEGQLRALLETVASAAGDTAIAVTDSLREAEADRARELVGAASETNRAIERVFSRWAVNPPEPCKHALEIGSSVILKGGICSECLWTAIEKELCETCRGAGRTGCGKPDCSDPTCVPCRDCNDESLVRRAKEGPRG